MCARFTTVCARFTSLRTPFTTRYTDFTTGCDRFTPGRGARTPERGLLPARGSAYLRVRMEIILRRTTPPEGAERNGTIYDPALPFAERRGHLELVCPACGALVVSQASEEMLARLDAVQCWNCKEWATGERRKS